MKKIYRILFLLVALIGYSSCNYLDIVPDETTTDEDTYADKDAVRDYLYSCYAYLPQCNISSGSLDQMTGDEVITAFEHETFAGFPKGNYSAATPVISYWDTFFQGIRQCYMLLERIDKVADLRNDLKVDYKAQTKFLIAYYHYLMARCYGPTLLIKETPSITTPVEEYLGRTPYDECVEWICNLFDEAANDLPAVRSTASEFGLATSIAAKSLKAKMRLYAASPLFNGGYKESLDVANTDGKKIFASYNANRWVTAKSRLEDLLNNAEQNKHTLFTVYNTDGSINPDESVYQLFQNYNDEILWATGDNLWNGSTMEQNTNPRDCYTGWGYLGVSQDLVDAFFVKDGLTIDDPGSLYKEDGFTDVVNPCNENKRVDTNVFNMYANREPRFYAGVGYEGKSWHIQPVGRPDYTLGFAKGEGCDNSSADNPRTGYLPTKFKNRQILFTGNYLKAWARPSILFRLADFYLYYAEVCNEINPNDVNIIKYLDMVRKRAGIPGYQELRDTGVKNIIGNQEEQREAIYRERTIEMMGEGNYYFDMRRWMRAGWSKDESGKWIKDNEDKVLLRTGMDIDKSAVETFNAQKNTAIKFKEDIGEGSYYNRIVKDKFPWKKAMLLYPVPYNEMQKSKLAVQNPLWE